MKNKKYIILIALGWWWLFGALTMLFDGDTLFDKIGGFITFGSSSIIHFWFAKKYHTKTKQNVKEYHQEQVNTYTTENTPQENISYCSKCGQVLESSSVCPDCDILGTAINNIPNLSYKKFMNDYATTIVLWGYESPRQLPKSNNNVPVYFSSELNIKNVKLFMNQIIINGYLRKANIEELFNILKVSELKELLKKYNLSTTGNKPELIHKVVSNKIPLPNNIIPTEYYIISNEGKNFLTENYEYIELHKHQKYQIMPKEYYNIRKQLSKEKGYKFNDCVWRIFNNRIFEYSKNKEYWQLYFNYLNMGELTYSEGRYNVAIGLYVKCLVYQLCGVSHYHSYKCSKEFNDKKWIIDSIKRDFYIDNNILTKIVDMQSYYNESILKNVYDTIEMNFKLCSIETIQKIIHNLFNDAQFDIEEYIPIIKHEQLRMINKYL